MPVVFILCTISVVNFGRPMDIHRGNIAFWVNSACIWAFCVFILLDYDDILCPDYNIEFI